jgi:hypothetical protein
MNRKYFLIRDVFIVTIIDAILIKQTDDWVSRDNLSSAICYACSHDKSNCSERRCRRLKLENIWRRAVGKCPSKSIKNFLRKEGYLSSVHVTEGEPI